MLITGTILQIKKHYKNDKKYRIIYNDNDEGNVTSQKLGKLASPQMNLK